MELFTASFICYSHIIWVSIAVGSGVSQVSTYTFLAIDFIINIYGCFDVWWKYRKEQWTECGEALLHLVLMEFIEFQAPCTYLLCFLAMYYGPNAQLIGELCFFIWVTI